MKKFGKYKTLIENTLINSYGDKKKFKSYLRNFNDIINKDKNFSKLYNLYSDLSTPKNYDENTALMFLDEAVSFFRNSIQEVSSLKKYKNLNENNYEDIDILLSSDKNDIDAFIKAKKRIIERLCSKIPEKKPFTNIPISTIKKIVNKNISDSIALMTEDEKNTVNEIINISKKDLNIKFNDLRLETLKILKEKLKNESEENLINEIENVVKKIENEKPSLFTYFKLKMLHESIDSSEN